MALPNGTNTVDVSWAASGTGLTYEVWRGVFGPADMSPEAKAYWDAAIKKMVEAWDHRFLNDLPPFDKLNPSAENMARVFYEGIDSEVKKHNAFVSSVTVWASALFALLCGAASLVPAKSSLAWSSATAVLALRRPRA